MKQTLYPMQPHYTRLLAEYAEWLATLGYAESTVRQLPQLIREFFGWLELQEVADITLIERKHLKAFLNYLHTRNNYRKDGQISQGHINKYLQALKLLSKYVRHTGQGVFTIKTPSRKQQKHYREPLTKAEVQELYTACATTFIGHRDRAMLSLAYGCGLRRAELEGLLVQDILKERKLVFVRKGKNYKQRYVPMHEKVLADIEIYLSISRKIWLNGNYDAFFISQTGTPLSAQSLGNRILKLTAKATIKKPVSLHILRHSIATHLLENGMNIHQIAKFLGHTSLESTQIYTHLNFDKT